MSGQQAPSGLPQGPPPDRAIKARVQVGVAIAAGALVGVLSAFTGWSELAPLIGWDVATLVYLTWVWASIRHADPERTAQRAVNIDPNRPVTDVLLLTASVASLGAVALVLARAGQSTGAEQNLQVGLGVLSVVLSWAVVHTIFTLQYARLYYADDDGGVDFNQPEPPDYGDFAYLAFTIGMTFQVSDTTLTSKDFRRTALRHALLSYLFGTGLLATTINLVAGITSR